MHRRPGLGDRDLLRHHRANAFRVAARPSLPSTTSVYAGTQCSSTPQSASMPQTELLHKLVDADYTRGRFQRSSGNVYKMHGWDKDGRRVEIYLDPADGRTIKTEANAS
jgi:hypothetical protein